MTLRNCRRSTTTGNRRIRAKVYSCAGHRFIAYLESYTDEDKAALEKSMKNQLLLLNMMQSYPPQVKWPGDKDWVAPRARKKYEEITTPVCPDGSTDTLELVAPNE